MQSQNPPTTRLRYPKHPHYPLMPLSHPKHNRCLRKPSPHCTTRVQCRITRPQCFTTEPRRLSNRHTDIPVRLKCRPRKPRCLRRHLRQHQVQPELVHTPQRRVLIRHQPIRTHCRILYVKGTTQFHHRTTRVLHRAAE